MSSSRKPDFENLRKQAKLYLRWHRDGYHPVAALIRSLLPRFAALDDRAVMQASFKLADAQEMVARQSGFDSWQALKTGATPMTKSPVRAPSSILHAEPQLFVADIENSLAFFIEKLGFEKVFAYGTPPFYAQVRRDAVSLNLRLVCEPVFVGDIREREHLLSASFTMASSATLKDLFLVYQEAGVAFHQTLKSEPWGARTFIVRDPDGNLLLFAAPS